MSISSFYIYIVNFINVIMYVVTTVTVSEAEVPVAARGRSSGSKQRKMGEKITEDKSEKVIRSV